VGIVGWLGTHRSCWFHVKWFGAPDIVKPDETLTCKGEQLQLQGFDQNAIPGTAPIPWIERIEAIPADCSFTPNDIIRNGNTRICKPIYVPRTVYNYNYSKLPDIYAHPTNLYF